MASAQMLGATGRQMRASGTRVGSCVRPARSVGDYVLHTTVALRASHDGRTVYGACRLRCLVLEQCLCIPRRSHRAPASPPSIEPRSLMVSPATISDATIGKVRGNRHGGRNGREVSCPMLCLAKLLAE